MADPIAMEMYEIRDKTGRSVVYVTTEYLGGKLTFRGEEFHQGGVISKYHADQFDLQTRRIHRNIEVFQHQDKIKGDVLLFEGLPSFDYKITKIKDESRIEEICAQHPKIKELWEQETAA